MSQGFTSNSNLPLPLATGSGGTGLTSSGAAGNILNSNGSVWQSVTPLNATPNYGLTYIMARGIF